MKNSIYIIVLLFITLLTACMEESSDEQGACSVKSYVNDSSETKTFCDQRSKSECSKWPSVNSTVITWSWKPGSC